ncbi:MAG: V-type ATP synthase subunit D [Candidatus Omnitrophica bacterium]|nr:V-type ATP synthase subunit D [Candidatus Omnitrophota bacterium]
MKVNLAATKTNLLRVKKTLTLTHEGYELLDEKRKILINELNTIIHITERLQKQVDEALQEGYRLVDNAIVVMGRRRMEELSFSIDIKNSISISQRRVMGVNIPVINLQTSDHPPYYSPYEVSLHVDEVILKFKDIVKSLAQLAEKKIASLRIAKEVQKTIRKVNALEKIYIPYYEESLKFISDRLDEESRESFSMLKLIKKKLRS